MVVDLWYVRTAAVDERARAACAAVMAPDEWQRHARFHFERHRHEFLVTRGLARGVLATYARKPPAELRFTRTELGRPLLEPASGIAFNLTNTTELVACAVAPGCRVGVDAEPLARAETILDVAETVFTQGERDGLAALPLEARRRRAVELWTVKEAYIKARSLGMTLPVERVEVVFPGGDVPEWTGRSLRYYPPVVDPARWELSTFEVEGHLLSTCVEVEEGTELQIRLRPAPLGELLGV